MMVKNSVLLIGVCVLSVTLGSRAEAMWGQETPNSVSQSPHRRAEERKSSSGSNWRQTTLHEYFYENGAAAIKREMREGALARAKKQEQKRRNYEKQGWSNFLVKVDINR